VCQWMWIARDGAGLAHPNQWKSDRRGGGLPSAPRRSIQL